MMEPQPAEGQDPAEKIHPFNRHEIAVEARRLYLGSDDERTKLKCLELALELSTEAPQREEPLDPATSRTASAYEQARRKASQVGPKSAMRDDDSPIGH